jgi:hypothetical protein
MSRNLKRGLATISAATAATVYLMATTSTEVASETPRRCIAVDQRQSQYDTTHGPTNYEVDRVAGRLIGYIATKCGKEEPGENMNAKLLGHGVVDLTFTRTLPSEGPDNRGGSYSLSATTVLTPEGLISPVAATNMQIRVAANGPAWGNPQITEQFPLYDMEARYDMNGWEVSVGTDGAYSNAVDPYIQDDTARHIAGAATAIMADADQGNSLIYRAR